jgi:hypothetical protein
MSVKIKKCFGIFLIFLIKHRCRILFSALLQRWHRRATFAIRICIKVEPKCHLCSKNALLAAEVLAFCLLVSLFAAPAYSQHETWQ